MDFDSLSISKNNNIQKSYSSDYNGKAIAKNADFKVSEESKVNVSKEPKTNSADLRKDGKIQEDGKSIYKGNYKEDMEKAVKLANEKLREVTNKHFSYSIHEATRQVIISIKDADGNVIKEVPSEESLDFFAKLQELSGILLDKKR